jgi:protein-S-isoprenylcysteine O-methyltransferase Ste14
MPGGATALNKLISAVWLGLRSFLWMVLIPGVYAGYVPWRWFGLNALRLDHGDPVQLVGLGGIAAGVTLLLICIWEFASAGRGTLAPVDPPRELVVRGLYRYVRNPMYLGVSAIVLGEAILARSPALLLYWAIWFLLVNLIVMGYEEPGLRRRFGSSYDDYARRVGRWLPRVR